MTGWVHACMACQSIACVDPSHAWAHQMPCQLIKCACLSSLCLCLLAAACAQGGLKVDDVFRFWAAGAGRDHSHPRHPRASSPSCTLCTGAWWARHCVNANGSVSNAPMGVEAAKAVVLALRMGGTMLWGLGDRRITDGKYEAKVEQQR